MGYCDPVGVRLPRREITVFEVGEGFPEPDKGAVDAPEYESPSSNAVFSSLTSTGPLSPLSK